MLKNKILIFIPIIILISILSIREYNHLKVKKAPKIVILKTKVVEVYKEVRLKDLIASINGKLIDNKKIDTTSIGEQEIAFSYITNTGVKVPYKIKIKVVDSTPPLISQIDNYTLDVNSKVNLVEKFFCGDNYDKKPICKIEGNYDLTKPGTYPIKLIGIDSSKNQATKAINLIVKEKEKIKNNYSTNVKETKFEDIIKTHKTNSTQIGIDVSKWQGNINFKQLKENGVEFAYIRIGRGDGIGKKPILDEKFKRNIQGFTKEKIPVGVYFYSSANNKQAAIKEAKWILKQLEKYKISLEIVFDWENWNSFHVYNQSFYSLTETYKAFQKTIEEAGYTSMLYSSKNHLETIWYPVKSKVWLAHYTNKTDYKGKYNVWQLCNNGQVGGIESQVDINVKYTNVKVS